MFLLKCRTAEMILTRTIKLAFLRLTILKSALTLFHICQLLLLYQFPSQLFCSELVMNRDVVTMIDRRS